MSKPISIGGYFTGFLDNVRTHAWWIQPVLTAVVLVGFVVYSFWASWQAEYYFAGTYLSPFYSPLLFIDHHAHGVPSMGLEHPWIADEWPKWWPSFLPSSPAFLI